MAYFQTVGDALQSAALMQQIDDNMTNKRLKAMQMRETLGEQLAKQQQAAAYQTYRSSGMQQPGGQPAMGQSLAGAPQSQQQMPQAQQMPPMQPPQLSEDTIAALKGKGKKQLEAIYPSLNRSYAALKDNPNDEDAIRALKSAHQMIDASPDIQALYQLVGMKFSESFDDKEKTVSRSYTGNFTREKLDQLADSIPGGGVLRGIAPGQGTLTVDPVKGGQYRGFESSKSDVKEYSPEVRLISETLEEKLGRKPTKTEIYNEERRTKVEDAKAAGENRYAPLLAGRGGDYLDTHTGKVSFVNVNKLNSDPGRYVSKQTPDFKAWTKNVEYERANSNFVNTIDRYSNLADRIMTKYGLNQGSKFENYTLQDAIKLQGLGSGDVAALNQVLQGLKQEIAKVESGSLGISGAHVETAKQFDRSISLNMPAKDLRTVFSWAKQAGRERLAAIHDETSQLKSGAMGEESSEKPKVEMRKSGETIADYLKRTAQ